MLYRSLGLLLLATTLSSNPAYANDEIDHDKIVAIELPEDFAVRTSSGIHEEHPTDKVATQDVYLEAYIQGIIDTKFPKSGTKVTVRHGDVLLTKLPKDKSKAKEISEYVRHFSSDFLQGTDIDMMESPIAIQEEHITTSKSTGIWLPQSTILFPSEIANPRQPSFSMGAQLGSSVAGQHASPVTFGGQFPIYRWNNYDLWGMKGDMQVDIEGCVFSVFNQTRYSHPLINSDFYVGVPLSYAWDKWALRARVYHISSHLGDEVHTLHHHIKRKNKSFEAIDFFADYSITKDIRVYGGVGVVAHSDSEMKMKPLYVEYGFEVRAFRHDWKQLMGQPFLACHIQNWQDVDYKFDTTFALGYEWGKISGIGRKIRLFLEYHDGFSQEGQFSRHHVNWVALRLAYGF